MERFEFGFLKPRYNKLVVHGEAYSLKRGAISHRGGGESHVAGKNK